MMGRHDDVGDDQGSALPPMAEANLLCHLRLTERTHSTKCRGRFSRDVSKAFGWITETKRLR